MLRYLNNSTYEGIYFCRAFAMISISRFPESKNIQESLILKSPNRSKIIQLQRNHMIVRNPSFSAKRITLSVLGFFPFSISFKYDFESSVILAKPNKDKFLLVRACLSFSPKLI
jgi:hypothetical protein